MKIPCVVIDLKTNKRYTIDQFASELHNGLLKELVNENIIDNTKLKGRTELLNVSPKATEEVKVATRKVVEKAFKSVKNLIEKTTGKKAKLEIAKNRDEMIALVKSHGGTEADATARGYYYGNDGTIVINEEYGTTETGGHEHFHPILDALEAYKPEVLNKFVTSISKIKGGQEFIQSAKLGYPTLEGELPKLGELLEKAKADGKTEVVDKLQQRIDNINRDITQQKKEIITDFFAKIADGTFKVDQTNYEMVRDYVLQTLKAMGIKLSEKNLAYLDQKALMDLVKVISDKFEKGEEITAQDIGLEKFELISEQNKLQQMKYGSFEKKGFEETKEYQDLKEAGYINEAFEIRTIAGRPAVTINPDNMITGAIFSEKGTPIIDGNGGIHFVSKYGDVWASSDAQTANTLAKYINQAREKDIANGGDGNIHVVVSKGSLGKTLTSHTGSKGSMRVLEYLVDENLIPLSDFRKALNEVGKKYGIEFNGKADAKTIHAEIAQKFFGVTDSSFKSRGYFVRDLIKNLSENSKATHDNIDKIRTALNSQEVGRKIAFKYEGVRDAIGSLFADQMTQGVPDSNAYATIEISGPVEVIAPETNAKGSHESYPYHIRQVNGERPKLNILSEPIHIKDLANPIEGKSGLGNDQTGMAEINIKPQFSKSEIGNESTTFTTRTGERIGYNYNTDQVARERFDFSKLKRLGGGSDRDVFDLGDGKLLKVAKTARGLEQNIYEGDSYLSFTPEVYERGVNYVVVEKVEAPLVSNKGGVELQSMLKELSQFTQQDFDNRNPELQEVLAKYGLEDIMGGYDVIWNDFTAKRNWGLKDGEPVHVDGGTFGGIKMLDRYRGKKNLSDPEFRQIYNQSKDLKKQFGDTDKFRQFSKSEVGETVEETAEKLRILSPIEENIVYRIIGGSGEVKFYKNFIDKKLNEAYLKLGKNKFSALVRKYIDPDFTVANRKRGNMTLSDVISNSIEEFGHFLYGKDDITKSFLKEAEIEIPNINSDNVNIIGADAIAEKYHKADGTNPELVKAVESMFGTPSEGGMQFSKSEIPNAPEEVSIKNAAIDEARAARGAEPVATQARQTWGDAWDKAVVKVNNGESPEVLAKDIARSPRSLNDVEHAMLFMNELDLNNKYWNLIDQINKGEGDVKNLQTQLDDVKRKLEDNEYAIRASGTETARGLAIRRWSKKADYSAEALKAEARAANKGVELDAQTSEALENKAKEIQKAQEASDEYDAKMREKEEERKRKEAEAAEKKALKELEEKVAFKTATRDEINTYIDKRRNKLAELIAKRDESKGGIQLAKSEAPINYEELIQQEIKEIAKGYFALGNMDMNSLVKAVHEDLQGLDPSFTERDVRDAISGYKGNKPRMTKPAIDVEMQDLKAQMKKLSEIEDYNKNNPSRVKKAPAPKSKELTDLENQYADKVKEQKLWNELEQLSKEGLPKPETRAEKRQLSQDIQDLQEMISEKRKELGLKAKIEEVEQGNLPEKGEPKKPLSPELQKLQDEYNKKKRLLEISNELDELNKGNRKAPATKAEVDADVQAAQEKLAEAKRIDDMMKKAAELDTLDSNVNYLNQEIDRLRNTGENDVADILQQQLNDLIEANKKKPKESKPKTQKEIDLRNKIKKKEKELGIDGADEAKLKAAKTRMQNRIDELQRMIDTRNFDKPEPKPVELDEEGFKLKAELERKKLEADKIIEEERRKNMTSYERGIDTFNKIQRAMVLSGVPVLFKLVTAGAARVFLAKPAEALVGMAINKFIPKKIKDKLVTERYGDFWKTQAKATTEWFKKENWLGDEFMKIVKTGVGTYDEMFGDKKYGLEDSKFEFFGRLHAALKSPTKRAEWLRSYEKRYIKAAEMGEDVSNLDVQYRLGSEAYIDAMNSIFMGDNAISKSYTDWLNQLERGGKGAKLTGAFMRMLIPVVKIPTNYVLETAQYTPGFGLISKDMFNIVKNGFDNLTPEQADFLIKIAKRQGVGFAAFAVGAMNSDNIGGYYQEGEKRGRDDVKAMDIKIGDTDISHTFLHSPLFEIMQMGATWARIYKKSILEGKTMPSAVGSGGFESITGLLEQIPQAPAIEDLSKALKSDEAWMNWLGSTANRMVVPQLMRNITSLAEEKTTEGERVKRQPRGFSEQMMKGTGLDTAPIRVADYIDVSLKKDYEGSVNVLSKIGALDDLSDIDTKKFLIYDSKKEIYKPIYLDRVQVNQLNKLAREKFIQMIKDNPILSAKNPMEAWMAQGDSKEQEEFMKLSEDERAMPLKNLVANLWSQAKTEAKYEKGYITYDENKITKE
jgi:hypothetical protein